MARILRRRTDDGGYVLPVVMGVAVVILILVATSLTVAGSGYTKASRDADYSAALTAAYGGLSDYQSRLSNDSRYFRYGNPASAFTRASGTSVVSLPADPNPAFGVSPSDGWATIPGSDQGSSYRYEVDNSKYFSQGILRLRVTGRVGQATRSIVADLRQEGFLNYVYFSDIMTEDPSVSDNDPSCAVYAWQRDDKKCSVLGFMHETINGPLHTNDRFVACDTTFAGEITTSAPGGKWWEYPCGANRFQAGPPRFSNPLPVPASNAEMKKETRSDLADVPNPGCLYTGPTSITYNGDGTMTVQSPWTKFTNTTGSGVGSAPARCGKIADLGSAAGATIPVLDGNLVYVQNVPAAGSGDPNAFTGYPAKFVCSTRQNIPGASAADSNFEGWSYYSTRYPVQDEIIPSHTDNGSKKAYGCQDGDVFVRGTVKGATTVAAENFVYVTGDLAYSDTSKDVLGLVGNNAVWIWNPRKVGGGLVDTSQNRTLQAAVMSVAHTFSVQNYDIAPSRGLLNLYGSVAQKFAGATALSDQYSGFSEHYLYDQRLRSIAPPKFITPVSTTYETLRAGGVSAAYDATGKAL